VLVAGDQSEALVQLDHHGRAPDGILADYRLPHNQTGIETIRAIYAQYQREIPALIVTGDIDAALLKRINDNGFPVLHKPVAAVKLRTFLRHVQQHQKTSNPQDTTATFD
jgi:CheY-like chemotaxis protein